MLSLSDLIEVILKFKPSRLISLKSLLMQVIWSVSILRFYLWFFCVTCKDLMSSDNRISSSCSQNLPPPHPSLVSYIWDLQTSVTVISLARVPQKIKHPIYTKNVHWLTFEPWMTCCSDYFCFINNMTLSFTCSVKYVNWYTFIIKTK